MCCNRHRCGQITVGGSNVNNRTKNLEEDRLLIRRLQTMASEMDDEDMIADDPRAHGISIDAAALEGHKEGSIISHIRSRRSAWTADQLAALFEMSSKTIYKMAASGRIPSFRIGGVVRFDPGATADWLEARCLN
jgi:excisionase family DNA binding protein